MLSLGYPGSALGFRRPTLRARMALLYGAVICASGVALLGVTQLLAPGLLQHGGQKVGGPGPQTAVTPGPQPTSPSPSARRRSGASWPHSRSWPRSPSWPAG
jgi:hypothetical protein